MKLIDFIQATDWKAVSFEITKSYPEYSDRIGSFKEAYREISALASNISEMQIHIEVETDPSSLKTFDVEVFGMDGSYFIGQDHVPVSERVETKFDLSHCKWEEWLGMNVESTTQQKFSTHEIVAHCLFEMTYLGFSQDQVQSRLQELIEQTNEIMNREQ